MRKILLIALMIAAATARAQVGEHRSDFSVGVNGGYALSNLAFVPKVNQGFHGGMTAGLSMRYVCEKYFNSICAIVAEVNYSQIGWKENIIDDEDQPVVNSISGEVEKYSRTLNYIQVPVLARLGWGREDKGFQFFFQLGPQLGYYLSDSYTSNFVTGDWNTGIDISNANLSDRSSVTIAQDTMQVENKLDYGIAAGLGVEYTVPHLGHFLLEGRYYYGLGNIYGDSKKDYFARSNFGNIVVKMTYLFDITKSKRVKRK